MAEDIETFRDHLLSIYQSVVEDVARQLDAQGEGASGPRSRTRSASRSASSILPSYAAEVAREYLGRQQPGYLPSVVRPSDRALSVSDAARVCTRLAFRYLQARLSGDAKLLTEVRGEFTASTCDPAWVQTVERYLRYFGPSGTRKAIPYVGAETVGNRTIEMPSSAKIALLADWGTGAQPAIELLKRVSAHSPDIVIHLGDIYYSGTPEECEHNFRSIMSGVFSQTQKQPLIYTLSGNHDMYSGGEGYYNLITSLNPAPQAQFSSFFCLRSSAQDWQILAMDTGLHDYNPLNGDGEPTFLEASEIEWHRARISEFPGRTILLSHHQLFSAYARIGRPNESGVTSSTNPHLLEFFNSICTVGEVCAWFWGHEHTLSIYQPFAGLQKGRCIGHGAVPVSIEDTIYVPLPDLDHIPSVVGGTQLKKLGGVYSHGYAMLELGITGCRASYFQVDGIRDELIYDELLVNLEGLTG